MANEEPPVPDHSEGFELPEFSQGLDRRRVIKYGSVAAGAAFLTPTLLTLGASPASASGVPSDQSAGQHNSAAVTSLTTSALQSPVGILVAVVTLVSNDQVITPTEDGWTGLTRTSTTSASNLFRNCTQVFHRYYSEAQSNTSYTFSWPTGAAAAVTIMKFERATTVVSTSTPVLSTSGTSRATGAVTPSVPSGATGPPAIVFAMGFSRNGSSVPTPASPTDPTNGTYIEYAQSRNVNVGAMLWVKYPAAFSTVTPSVGSMTNTRPSVVTALVVT